MNIVIRGAMLALAMRGLLFHGIRMNHAMTRRQALKSAAVLAAGVWTGGCLTGPGARRFELGLATISLSKFPPQKLIAAAKELELRNVSLYGSHCPWAGGTPEQCRMAAQTFKDAGLRVTGCGVINLPNQEATVRRAFENAKAVGLPTMICKPDHDAFPLIEKYVKQYNIRLAIHNHGPGDTGYPSPLDAWNAAQPYDKRIGLCIDVGHGYRAGADPAESIRTCHQRLYDVHLKDTLAEVGARTDIPVEVGRGRLDIKGILAALMEVKYSHIVAFEYEKKEDNPMVGLTESVHYVRKLLA
jgi:sugar phosphate isomerase/epimerase